MKKKIMIIAGAVVCVLVVIAMILLYRHERRQSIVIQSLNATINEMKGTMAEAENVIAELRGNSALAEKDISELKADVEFLGGRKEYLDEGFNYLAIGNSITIHGKADYWWDEIGMAASSKENDYVHLIAKYLEDNYGAVCFYATNFYNWEVQSYDRAETYKDIYPYLSDKLDLVTIQLGENVTDISTYESDYIALINHIREVAPQAQILVIDDFWYNEDKTAIEQKACEEAGVVFISLDDIKGKNKYKCGMGTTVYDSAGNPHVVEHGGVADHPGDEGMKAIAERVIPLITLSGN